MTEKIYTVLELNDTVKEIIREAFPDCIWVCGEIQDLRERAHINFNLVQKHTDLDQIIAQVKAVIFENMKPRILKRIKETDSEFEFKNDIEVKLLCRVDLYSKTGQFSLTVVDIDPVYTLGKIAQNRVKILNELRQKGLLDKNKLKEISAFPLKVGLVTAQNSAAYHDFINELKISGYGFKVLTYDCYMQGQFVERDAAQALKYFDKLSKEDLDIVVITRGGGSTADLSCFDSKKLAQAIAHSEFPVITGLGHEINITIMDMAAHTSVKTPTAAAKFLVDRVKDFADKITDTQKRILNRVESFISGSKKDLESTTIKMESLIMRYFKEHKDRLRDIRHTIRRVLEVALLREKETCAQSFRILKSHLHKVFTYSRQNISHIEEKVKLLNPKNVLRRGYSITLREGKVLKDVNNIEVKDLVETILYNGRIVAEVKNTSKE